MRCSLLQEMRVKKGLPASRGAVVVHRNLHGVPFPSSRFFAPIWQREVKEQLEKVCRERKRGIHDLSSLLVALTGIVQGEIFFLKKTQKVWQGITVNGCDHLQIFAERRGEILESLLRVVDFWDNRVEEKVTYAYHPRWGYLASSFTRVGTGCNAYLWVHLPALSFLYGEKRLLQWFQENGTIVVRGWGDKGEIWAHLFEITNRFTLGLSERDIVSTVEGIGGKVLHWEEEVRRDFLRSPARLRAFWEYLEQGYKEMARKDDNMGKALFDFVSLWWFGEEMGIIPDGKGLECIGINHCIGEWLADIRVRQWRVEALRVLGVWPRRILSNV